MLTSSSIVYKRTIVCERKLTASGCKMDFIELMEKLDTSNVKQKKLVV